MAQTVVDVAIVAIILVAAACPSQLRHRAVQLLPAVRTCPLQRDCAADNALLAVCIHGPAQAALYVALTAAWTVCNLDTCYLVQGPGAIAPQPDEADIEEFLSTIRDYPTPPREYFDIEAKV